MIIYNKQLIKNKLKLFRRSVNHIKLWYDKKLANRAIVSIGDILLKRGELNHQQYLILSRILDVKNYCEKRDKTFVYQNSIGFFAYGKPKNLNGNFIELIQSFEIKGYDKSSLLDTDSSLCVLNGTHRVAASYYFDNRLVNVRVFRYKSVHPDNFDWYYKVGMGKEMLDNINDQYEEVERKLVKEGDTFCCLIGGFSEEDTKSFLRELDLFVHVKKVFEFILNKELSRELNKEQYADSKHTFIQFVNRVNPDYTIKNGYPFAKRIKEVADIFENRYNISHDKLLHFSFSCYEGKKLFDKVKQINEE